MGNKGILEPKQICSLLSVALVQSISHPAAELMSLPVAYQKWCSDSLVLVDEGGIVGIIHGQDILLPQVLCSISAWGFCCPYGYMNMDQAKPKGPYPAPGS